MIPLHGGDMRLVFPAGSTQLAAGIVASGQGSIAFWGQATLFFRELAPFHRFGCARKPIHSALNNNKLSLFVAGHPWEAFRSKQLGGY
jgi:hypothetical protein